jgi:hypothetical protein
MGDSFSKGAFGKTLDAQLRAAGFEVFTSVTGGASAYDWLPEFGNTSCDIGYWEKTPRSERRVSYISRVPKLDFLVESFRPDVVVIQGGTNMYSVLTSKRRSRDANTAEFERLLDRMGEITRAGGAQLYWVTPATAHPERFSPELQDQMKSALQRVVGKYGRVFDSYAVTRFTDPYPGTDGIHYGPTEAAAWARLVARDVIAFAGVPAHLDRPPEPRANRGDRRDEGNVPPQPRGRRNFWDIFKRDRPPGGQAGAAAAPAITIRRAELVRPRSAVREPASARRSAPGSDVIEVEVRLRQKSAAKSLNEITYRSALGVYEYDVLRVIRGDYPHPRIRIAHLIVMNNRYTTIHHRPLGGRMSLAVEPLSNYPNLEKVQTIDDLPEDFSLPVFVPKL